MNILKKKNYISSKFSPVEDANRFNNSTGNTYNGSCEIMENKSLKEDYFNQLYVLTADDMLSNSFVGYEDFDNDFDKYLRKVQRIVKLLKSNLQTCVAVQISDDEIDDLPSMNFYDTDKIKDDLIVVHIDGGVTAIEQSIGYQGYFVWFKNEDEARMYFNMIHRKNQEKYEDINSMKFEDSLL